LRLFGSWHESAARDEKRAVLRVYLAVGVGAAIGSLLRFLSIVLIVSVMGQSGLWATGFVNVVGSFVIGLFAALAAPDGRLLVGPEGRQFVMGGICGGFTTFSSMSLDTFILLLQDDIPLAGIYLALVVGLSLVAAWVGHIVAVRLNRSR
jgi:fluoride exporter